MKTLSSVQFFSWFQLLQSGEPADFLSKYKRIQQIFFSGTLADAKQLEQIKNNIGVSLFTAIASEKMTKWYRQSNLTDKLSAEQIIKEQKKFFAKYEELHPIAQKVLFWSRKRKHDGERNNNTSDSEDVIDLTSDSEMDDILTVTGIGCFIYFQINV